MAAFRKQEQVMGNFETETEKRGGGAELVYSQALLGKGRRRDRSKEQETRKVRGVWGWGPLAGWPGRTYLAAPQGRGEQKEGGKKEGPNLLGPSRGDMIKMIVKKAPPSMRGRKTEKRKAGGTYWKKIVQQETKRLEVEKDSHRSGHTRGESRKKMPRLKTSPPVDKRAQKAVYEGGRLELRNHTGGGGGGGWRRKGRFVASHAFNFNNDSR